MSQDIYLKKSYFQNSNQKANNQFVPYHDNALNHLQIFSNELSNKLNCFEKGQQWYVGEGQRRALFKHTDATSSLINNKKTSMFDGQEIGDSPEMLAVKRTAANITQFFLEHEISKNESTFDSDLRTIQSFYTNLKDACTSYLDQKKYGWKTIWHYGESYRRYQLVKNTLTRARAESKIIDSKAKDYYAYFKDKEDDERPLWINILEECRTKELNINYTDKNVEYCKGFNNEKYIKLQTDSETVGYVMEEERNVSGDEMAENYFSNRKEVFYEECVNQTTSEAGANALAKDFFRSIDNCFRNNDTISNKICRIVMIKNKDFRSERMKEKIMGIIKEEFDKGFDNRISRATDQRSKEKANNCKVRFDALLESETIQSLIMEYGEYYYNYLDRKWLFDNAKLDENADVTGHCVATYRLAELLGIPALVPAAAKVKYHDKYNNMQKGILTTQRKSENQAYVKTYREIRGIPYDISMQMNSLRVLDLLTGRPKRSDATIAFRVNKNEEDGKYSISDVIGKNNDICFGKLTYKEITSRTNRPIKDRNGMTISVIDERVYRNVLALDDSIVKYLFAELLSQEEIKYFLNRLHGVQELLRKLVESNAVKIDNETTRKANSKILGRKWKAGRTLEKMDWVYKEA